MLAGLYAYHFMLTIFYYFIDKAFSLRLFIHVYYIYKSLME
jgi:hypothetical protein